MPLGSDVSIDYLAQKSEGYVGADIEAVCREAAIFVLREDIKAKKVTKKAFEKALEKVRPSVTKEIDELYRQMQDYFKQAHAKQMEKEKPSYYG
jgi:transitional endoplasmic reticulum ATPase